MPHALRSLSKSPGFFLVAVLTLSLGIAANITFFSVLYGVVLRPLPYPNASELVEVQNAGKANNNEGKISVAELRDYRARQKSFTGIAAYSVGRTTLSQEDGAERVVQTRVTANLFPLLGVQPSLGRVFSEDEERDGKDRVVLVSDEFRQRHFAGRNDILGQVLRLNGVEHTIVGVMPAGFTFSPGEAGTVLWKPLDLSARGTSDRTDRFLSTLARLAKGQSIEAASADLHRVARQLQADQPGDYPVSDAWTLRVVSLKETQLGGMFAPLGMLMAAAGTVLLIAIVNVSIMFLLRAASRRREMMIRLAIGASRWHIVRQLLVESAIICAIAAALGLGVASFGVEVLKSYPPANIPRLSEVTIDAVVALVTMGILFVATLGVGIAPAAALFRTRAPVDVSQTHRSTEGRSAVRLRETLTTVQIALAVMLLVGGGLTFRSLQKLLNEELGFSTDQLFTFKTNLTASDYPDRDTANSFYERLTSRLEGLPGVSAVAAVSYLPLSNESQFTSAALTPGGQALPVAWRVVRGPYFSVMGITLLQGRLLDDKDKAGAPLVTVVDEAFARRNWSDQSAAIGQTVFFGNGSAAKAHTVVGIVKHLKHRGPGQDSLPEVFVSHAQTYQRGMYTVIKAGGVANVGSSRVDLQACKLEYSIVSPK